MGRHGDGGVEAPRQAPPHLRRHKQPDVGGRREVRGEFFRGISRIQLGPGGKKVAGRVAARGISQNPLALVVRRRREAGGERGSLL